MIKFSAYERRPGGGGWKFVSDVDPEDCVAQQDADLEANPRPAVERQVEAGDIHQHEEDARDQEAHNIQQGAPADQHLRAGRGKYCSSCRLTGLTGTFLLELLN